MAPVILVLAAISPVWADFRFELELEGRSEVIAGRGVAQYVEPELK